MPQVARCETSYQHGGEALGGRWRVSGMLGVAQPLGETTLPWEDIWGVPSWRGARWPGHGCGIQLIKNGSVLIGEIEVSVLFLVAG